MNVFAWTASVLIAYLLAAIPFGLLIGRARGVDIRQCGSRNIGATNVMRTVGKGWGVATLLLDALKGYLPVATLPLLMQRLSWAPDAGAGLAAACGCAAILGHNFPVYLRFKGGKGIATSAGVLLALAPAALLAGVIAFALVFGLTRIVSLGSIAAAIAAPVTGIWRYWHTEGPLVPIILVALGMLAILRHRANIVRLIHGTESRIRFGKPPRSEPDGKQG